MGKKLFKGNDAWDTGKHFDAGVFTADALTILVPIPEPAPTPTPTQTPNPTLKPTPTPKPDKVDV